MASRARSRYQGGASFNVFSAQGSNPTGDCKICGKGVQKVYDKSVKGYVYSLSGGPASKIQLPKDESKAGLQLLQPFLVFQLFVPAGQPLSLELRVTDTANTRRKMYFSTSFSDIKATPLHCQIPIALVTRNTWLSLSIHVADLFSHCFRGMSFRSVDVIVLGPVCKLRKIFTMRNQLAELGGMCGVMEMGGEECLPQEHMFALGVDTGIQVMDMAALQMAISGLADPSADGPRGVDNGLSAQKPAQNKLEPRQVHVAFGSRMPLPLSTVQINTNLPGDSKTHMPGAFPKDRPSGRNAHQQTHEPPLSLQEQKRAELKAETLQNLLKRANNSMGNDPETGRIRKESASEVKASVLGKPAAKADAVPGGIVALTSLTMKEFNAMHPREDAAAAVTAGLKQLPVEELAAGPGPSVLEIENVEGEVSEVGADANKPIPGKWVKVAKKKDDAANTRRELAGAAGLGKYTRRDSHMDSSRGKEYRQTRYMDSPPESPPCGWTSCLDRDASEEKPFSEHVFEGLSLFSKTGGLDNTTIAQSGHAAAPGSAASGTLSSRSKHSLHDKLGQLAQCASDNPPSERSVRELVNRSAEDLSKFMEDRPRPVGVAHEKFDLGNDENFVFHDSEFATMSEDDFSDGGGQSWSSGSSPQPQGGGGGDASDLLTRFPDASSFLNEEDEDTDVPWKLETEDTKGDLQGDKTCFEMDATLTKGDFGSMEEPWDLDDEDEDGGIGSPPGHFLLDATDAARAHESFDFGSALDHHDEALVTSPTIARPHSRTSNRDVNVSVGNNKKFGAHETPASSSSWQSTESLGQHSVFSFSLKTGPGAAKQQEEPESLEREGPVVNNGRPEEDLDLLYDPTLDCYYDPKTNRYYELK